MHTYTHTHIHTYIHTYIHNPPWNFLYTIATVKLGKMVRFNPLLCLGYLPSINVCNFIEDLGVSGSMEISRWIQHWVPVSWESWGLRFYSGICSLWMYVMLFNSIEKYWQNQFPTTWLSSRRLGRGHWHVFFVMFGLIGSKLECPLKGALGAISVK